MRLRIVVVAALTVVLASVAVPARGGLLGLTGSAPSGSTATQWNVFGRPCTPIGVRTAGVQAGGTCPGVRPGAVVRVDTGAQCTFNFLFRGGDGRNYMGTAGHCVLGEGSIGGGDVGERMWAPGTGPVAMDGDGRPVGRFAYAILQEPKDFALIRLEPGVAANPQMCQFGGPTGVNNDPTVGSIDYFGNGIVAGDLVPGRSALGIQSDADKVYAVGVATPGDSGAGVTSSDGRAVGALVGLSVAVGIPLDSGIVVTRLGPQVGRASQVLKTPLTLQTAPRL